MDAYTFLTYCLIAAASLPYQVHPGQVNDRLFAGRNYVVIASRILRPRSQFSISVHVYDKPTALQKLDNRSFQCYVTIKGDNDEVVSHKQTLYWNYAQLVYFQTPSTLQPEHSYELRVQGVDDADQTLIFDERSSLAYDSRCVSVVIQTTRPIYCAGQTVRFRILVLEMNLLPFNDALDVFIIDPDGYIMKRWLSVYTNNGVASLKFKLPRSTKNGFWKIRNKIDGQIDEKSIIVESYYQPMFEVVVSSAPYIPSTETEITCSLYGMYPSQKHIRGNATILWLAKKLTELNFTHVHQDEIFIEERSHEVFLSVARLQLLFADLIGLEIKIIVHMAEHMSLQTVSGFSHTRIIANKIILKFLSPAPTVFTPGTFLHGHLAVFYEDGERVPQAILQDSSLFVQMEADAVVIDEIKITTFYDDVLELHDMLIKSAVRQRFFESSVLSFRFDVPLGVSHLKLKAIFTYENTSINEEMTFRKNESPSHDYVQVWTTADDLVVSDYASFHVKASFSVDVFSFLIVSKGTILRVAEHRTQDGTLPLFTFSEVISADMAPWFHLIVYCISETGEIQGDAILVPVDGFSRYETSLEVNTGKDFRGEQVELVFSSAEGAFIGMQAVRSSVYHLQSGHEITKSRVTNSFLPFEKNVRALAKVSWMSRTGATPKQTIYYSSQGYADDVEAIFKLNYLVAFSNMSVLGSADLDECNEVHNQTCIIEECLYNIGSCVNSNMNCIGSVCEQDTQNIYLLQRINWNSFIFDFDEGDWGFFEMKNDHAGTEVQNMTTPRTADNWYFSIFNMDMVHGFSTTKHPVIFSSKRPLMAHLFGPSSCRRGEQLGLKLHIHNFDMNQLLVIVTLLASDDYKFVHVENGGFVATYNARLSGNDHEILIYMAAESENEIMFPVKPTVQQGFIEVQFYVSSQTGRQLLTHRVQVFGEGALINRHTSTTLDLKNRGFVLQFLDIVVEETPIIPYEIIRHYVYGSPAANLTISNSLIGPAIGESILTMNLLLGRESKGAMDLLFELHTNIWSLHYLRHTNQLDWRTLRETLYECNTLYAEVMVYFHDDGWFSSWEITHSRNACWLTAWALRVFKNACYPDWEFQFWIDPSVFTRIFRWLLNQQTEEGNFVETRNDKQQRFGKHFSTNTTGKTISLTAHVLISLYTAAQTINSEVKSMVLISCLKARTYLEKSVTKLRDPYLISVVTYALTLTSSPERETAFFILQTHMRTDGGGLHYWSRKTISENPVKVENQRHYLQPRTYRQTDSRAVEATSWSLLAYLAHNGVTPLSENIVQWLVSMKMTNNGFISLRDTAVAYEALTEFAYKARILDMTHVDLKIDLMMNTMPYGIHIGNRSSVAAFQLNISHVWGHVDLIGKGAGILFIQMDINYGIDEESFKDIPEMPIFDLNITEFYSHYRNKSSIIIQTCLRFIDLLREESEAAILEIQTPTGYGILESDALNVVRAKAHPTLRDARVIEGKSYWFFDFVEKKTHCFNHTVKRWYPVANMTLYRNALLYEIAAREQFVQVLINSTSLYVLSICEVCGSFQCPYCPYYNSADKSTKTNSYMFYVHFISFYFIVFTKN